MNPDKEFDEAVEILAYNLFAYVGNNPIKFSDKNGNSATLVVGGVTLTVGQILLAAIALLWLTDPNFRKLINSLLLWLVNATWSLVKTLVSSLSKAKQKRSSKKEVHHIVAKNDKRALASKNILLKYKISVENPLNKISLNYSLHKYLHTSAYHAGVYGILKIGDNKSKLVGVISGLLVIRAMLYIVNKLAF